MKTFIFYLKIIVYHSFNNYNYLWLRHSAWAKEETKFRTCPWEDDNLVREQGVQAVTFNVNTKNEENIEKGASKYNWEIPKAFIEEVTLKLKLEDKEIGRQIERKVLLGRGH